MEKGFDCFRKVKKQILVVMSKDGAVIRIRHIKSEKTFSG